MTTLPLNRAQRALWSAQRTLGDDVPLTIAQFVAFDGAIDVERLDAAVRVAAAMSGVGPLRLDTDADEPRLRLDPDQPATVEHLDFTGHTDPFAAAMDWMDAEAVRPFRYGEQAPLAFSALIRTAPEQWVLFSRAHHLALDGYAAMRLVHDTARYYRDGVSRPERNHLDVIADRRRAVLDHEDRYSRSPRHDRDREFWRATLANAPEPLVLAPGGGAPPAPPHRAGLDLDPDRARDLDRLAERAGVPGSAVVVAAVALCAARTRDAAHVPLTLATSARSTVALREAGSTLSNLLPVHIRSTASDTIADLLTSVTAAASAALRHQGYRYEQMVRDGHAPFAPLTHAGPVVNIAPFPAPEFDARVRGRYRVVSTGPVADVNVNYYRTAPETYRLEVETNAAAGTRESTDRLLADVLACLDELTAAAPSAALARCAAPGAHPALFRPPSGTAITFGQLLFRHARSDATAVLDQAGALSYRDLAGRAVALGLRLRALGVRAGARVAIVMERGLGGVTATWAVAWAGGCAVPLDTAHPAARQRAILDDAAPHVVLHDGTRPSWDGPAHVIDVTGFDGEVVAADWDPPSTPPDSPAFLVYTSGSTGAPKGVLVTHRGLADLDAEIEAAYDLAPHAVLAHAASPGFDTAVVELLAAAHAGAALAIVPARIRGGPELAAHLTAAGVTHLLTTPALLATLSPTETPTVTHLVIGGDRCPTPLITAWAATRTVRCAYGPTETTCSVLLTAPVDPGHRGPIPLGEPMSGVTAHVLDRFLRSVPEGGDGELYVAGPSLATGYQHRPAETASRFVADPSGPAGTRRYRTGDRVRVAPDGALVFLGRADRQVKVRGIRVDPGEVEAALQRSATVRAAAVVARDDDGVTRLHAYVVAEDTAEKIRADLAASVPAHLVPVTVTVLPALPMTVHNKIDRARLPVPSGSGRTTPAPRTLAEELAVEAFGCALGHAHRAGIDADFFALGGDSLAATAIVAHLGARTGRRLEVRDVFTAPTPRALADRLECAPRAELPPADEPATTALSPAQRAIPVPDNGIAHLIPFVLTVDGHLPSAAVTERVRGLLDAHEILRCTFTADAATVDPDPDPARWSIDPLDASERNWATAYLHRPFDLAAHYPLRVGVAHTARHTHVAIVFHHVAVDGRSLIALARTMIGLDGTGQDTAHRYSRYARMSTERTALARPTDLAFWREEIDPSRVLDGLTRVPRPTTWDPRGARHRVTLPPGAWATVEAAARHLRLSPLTLLRAVTADHLAARTGHRTIHIGALLSGRTDAEFAHTVGMFAATVPVVCATGPELADTVAATHAAENRAFAHARLPLPELAAALGGARPGAHPLFQVMLTVDESPATFLPEDSLAVRITRMPVDHAKCDLHLSFQPAHHADPGHLEILYATALFDRERVGALADGLLAALTDPRVEAWARRSHPPASVGHDVP